MGCRSAAGVADADNPEAQDSASDWGAHIDLAVLGSWRDCTDAAAAVLGDQIRDKLPEAQVKGTAGTARAGADGNPGRCAETGWGKAFARSRRRLEVGRAWMRIVKTWETAHMAAGAAFADA